MNLKKFSKKNKGFTLVEILVVILILGILIVALIPRISSALDKAKETQIKTDFRTFSTATESVLREYSGFAGVPMVAANGRQIDTIGEHFWANGLDVADSDATPVTVALIQAVNRYLESSYAFETNATLPEFGRSAASDPWKQPYEIYFVARSKDANTVQAASSDRIYITSSGKTNNTHFADYTMLCQYKAGEVRTLTVGFEGESYPADCDYELGQHNGRNYVALNDLFEYDSANGDEFFAITDVAQPTTLFKLGGVGSNFARLYVSTGTTGSLKETPNPTAQGAGQTANNPVATIN